MINFSFSFKKTTALRNFAQFVTQTFTCVKTQRFGTKTTFVDHSMSYAGIVIATRCGLWIWRGYLDDSALGAVLN